LHKLAVAIQMREKSTGVKLRTHNALFKEEVLKMVFNGT